jgi:hypothetical protein
LLDAGRTEKACPKFAESFNLEPATGTLLGLAICLEQQGKLASAWAKYTEVQGRAARDEDAEREAFAKDKVDEIQPRLSTLTITISETVATTAGLQILRDGVSVGRGVWGLPAPVDGGEHVVEVSAPGKRPVRQVLDIAPEGAAASVTIETLEDEAVPAAAATTESAPLGADAGPAERPWYGEMSTTRWAGVGAAGVGVVSLGIGGYFLSTALDADARARSECDGDVCNAAGARLRTQSVDDAGVATVFAASGVALVGAGAVLFFMMGDDDSAAHPSAAVTATVGPDLISAHLAGRF